MRAHAVGLSGLWTRARKRDKQDGMMWNWPILVTGPQTHQANQRKQMNKSGESKSSQSTLIRDSPRGVLAYFFGRCVFGGLSMRLTCFLRVGRSRSTTAQTSARSMPR